MVKEISLAAMILALCAGSAAAEGVHPPAGPRVPPAPRAAERDGKENVRLDEVRIIGSSEHPGVLFFLPRIRFRILPLRPDAAEKATLLRDDREKGALSP